MVMMRTSPIKIKAMHKHEIRNEKEKKKRKKKKKMSALDKPLFRFSSSSLP